MEDKYRIVEMEFIDFILDKLYENPVQVNITFPESNMLISREGSADLADQQWLINIVSDYMSIAEQIVSCVIETDVFHLTIVPPVIDENETAPKWDAHDNTEAPNGDIVVENPTDDTTENESNVDGPSFHDLCIALDELFDGTVGTEKQFGGFIVSCTSTDILHRWSFIPTNMPGAEQYRNVHYMVIDPAYDTVTINTDKQSCRIKGIHRGMAEVADTCYLEDGFINELIAAYIIQRGKSEPSKA